MKYADIDFVDENDAVIGSGQLSEVWAHNHIHRVARVFIFNSKGEFLLQKRSHLVMNPNRWDNSAAGHVDTGETYREAAVREAHEEMGIANIKLREVMKFYTEETFDGRAVRRFNMLYDAVHDGAVNFDTEEVSEVTWITPEALGVWMHETPNDFTAAFIDVFGRYKNTVQR